MIRKVDKEECIANLSTMGTIHGCTGCESTGVLHVGIYCK